MPAPRKLDPQRLTPSELTDETFFTLLMIRNVTETKALIATAQKAHDSAKAQAQRALALAEARMEAEVQVTIGNLLVDGVIADMRASINGKTDSTPQAPLYQRYFSKYRPSEVIRMALATELPIVEPWIPALKAETDPDLAALGTALEKAVAAGKAAVAGLGTARQAQKTFETGPLEAVFAEINSTRASLYGELSKLGKDPLWVESFFRPSPRRPGEDLEPSVAEATARLASQQQALAAAQAALAAAQQREAAAQAAADAREAKQKELDARKKEMQSLRARMAELEDELK